MVPKKKKLIFSWAIWFGTFTFGLGVSFLGASLLEMSQKFETDVATISKVFSILTISFLVGALVCGFLFNYINRQILSSLLLIVMGIGTACYPLAPSLVIFYGIASIVGFACAGFDTAQIVWIIEMWANEAAPYIQVQHFSFALGALVSPLLMKPFLSSSDTVGSGNVTESTTNASAQLSREFEEDVISQLYVPFLIGGIVTVLAGLVLFFLTFTIKYEKPAARTQEQLSSEEETKKSWASKRRTAFLVLLSGIFIGSYCGMELCSIQFLPSFTHFIPLKLSSSDAALVLSGLTGSYTVGRGIGIFLVFKISPEFLLLGNLILITLGNTILYFFANNSIPLLWTGCILLGTGFSTVFPSFYGYIEKHLEVTNVVGAIMIMAGGLVSSLYPIIIGTHIEENPVVLLYTNYVSLVICVVMFVLIFWSISVKEGTNGKVEVHLLGVELNRKDETKSGLGDSSAGLVEK